MSTAVPDQSYWSTLTRDDIERITQNFSVNFGSENLKTLREKIPVIGDYRTKKANECATLYDVLHDAANGKRSQSSDEMGPLFTATMKTLLGESIYGECSLETSTKSDADPFFRAAGTTNTAHNGDPATGQLNFSISINMPRFELGFESILTLFSLEKAVQGKNYGTASTGMANDSDVVRSVSPEFLLYVSNQ